MSSKNGCINIDETEGLLFVDATNAFNSLNQEVALQNILHICSSLGRVLVSVYQNPVFLFIDAEELLSCEEPHKGIGWLWLCLLRPLYLLLKS